MLGIVAAALGMLAAAGKLILLLVRRKPPPEQAAADLQAQVDQPLINRGPIEETENALDQGRF